MIAFIENKVPDMTRVAALLESCRAINHWANRGPLYRRLAEAYTEYFGLGPDRAVTPCANGGVALEAIARLLAHKAGRKLRWVGSAFSFQNLGRGYFADMRFVDCDIHGLLDLDAVRILDREIYDGLVVVNPFGLTRDFSAYAIFARETGKELIIDNAAGIDETIPDWPWQSFSLHHTKPYGAGEGGLALTPADAAEELYGLLDYGEAPSDPAIWLNNGRISDIACAFQLDRLERRSDWAPLYHEQAARVFRIAREVGLAPLYPFGDAPPATSWPYLAPHPVPLERIKASRRLTFGKFYKPLADLPRIQEFYARIVNIPTHPNVDELTDGELRDEVRQHVLHSDALRDVRGR